MTDQLDIHGNAQPLTWDGQPLYSPETVREGLFGPEAFEQMPGQLDFGEIDEDQSPETIAAQVEAAYQRAEDYKEAWARRFAETCELTAEGQRILRGQR